MNSFVILDFRVTQTEMGNNYQVVVLRKMSKSYLLVLVDSLTVFSGFYRLDGLRLDKKQKEGMHCLVFCGSSLPRRRVVGGPLAWKIASDRTLGKHRSRQCRTVATEVGRPAEWCGAPQKCAELCKIVQ